MTTATNIPGTDPIIVGSGSRVGQSGHRHDKKLLGLLLLA